MCDLYCEFGFVTDEDGCEVCTCADAPKSCTDDTECDTGTVCEPGIGCDSTALICVPGCHYDTDCPTNEHCMELACLTCPCPGMCTPTDADGT